MRLCCSAGPPSGDDDDDDLDSVHLMSPAETARHKENVEHLVGMGFGKDVAEK